MSPDHNQPHLNQKALNPQSHPKHLLKCLQYQGFRFFIILPKISLNPLIPKDIIAISLRDQDLYFLTIQSWRTPSLKPPKPPKLLKVVAHPLIFRISTF